MSPARVVLAAGLVLLADLVDVALLSRVSWPAATPDLTLLVVVALAVLGGRSSGAVAGLAAGLLVDLTPPGAAPLGVTAVAYGLAGAVAGGWHRPGERSALVPGVAAAAAAAVASGVLSLVALAAGASLADCVITVLGSVGYAAVGGLVVVPVVVLLDHWVEGEAPEVVRR